MSEPQKTTIPVTPDTSRARQLISQLQLQPHPEGGWYREVFRSAAHVAPQDGRPARSALTSIYFLLQAGQFSRWHRVLSDEVWVHLEGLPLDLWSWDAESGQAFCSVLGPVAAADPSGAIDQQPQHVIAAGIWQAARPQTTTQTDGFTLVACMVGPGFDFSDFRMMQAGDELASQLAAQHPELTVFI